MNKVDDYLEIITSGKLYDEVPEARGADLMVQYNVIDDPKSSTEIVRILEAAQRLHTQHGSEFQVVHLNMALHKRGCIEGGAAAGAWIPG